MQLNEISKFELTIESSPSLNEKLHITYSVGDGWRGTPGTDGNKIAELAIKFLKQNISKN